MSESEAQTNRYPKGAPRDLGRYGRPTYNQAQKIIAKFGGEAAFARAIGINRITAYRWQYRRPYGSDGLIPGPQIDLVNRAARIYGIVLSPKDWTPERITYEEATPAAEPGGVAE